ncbi:MAG: hypothetical protein UCL21_04415 [Bacilli bacterium]|jgi:hypothetical protein|nr:hypothetical protein [Bacilli bacterium]
MNILDFLGIGRAIEHGFRTLMFILCDGVYRLIYLTFYIFEKLGSARIIEDTQGIVNRISLIIGLFMVFRVTFAFVQYIVDPDAMLDKKKGAANIIKKIIISIVLLGSTSTLFNLAFKAQDLIIDNQIIGKIIFNSSSSNGYDSDSLYSTPENSSTFGGRLSAEVFSAFYRLNPEASPKDSDQEDCKTWLTNDDGNSGYSKLKEKIAQNKGALSGYKNSPAAICLNEQDSSDEYIVDFDAGGFLALAFGIAVLYTIFIFTIQVGVRVIQLAYLQIIAPIPIIMYITPKGDEQLKKWGQQCSTTFLDFFMRCTIIYFAILVIQNIWETGFIGKLLSAGTESSNGWETMYVGVIMIIAVLTFAKKVPNLIKEIFPSLGGAAGFDYGLSFKKQVVEPLKAGYNSPLGWGLKLGKAGAVAAIGAIDRKKYNLPKPRSKFQQKLDKLTPGRAEAIKNVTEGRKEVREIDNKWNDGVEIAKKFTSHGFTAAGTGSTGWDKALDGTTRNNYKIVFKHDEFITSKMNLDKAKKEMETLRDGLLQVQSGGTFTYGGVTYNTSNVSALSDKYNSQSGAFSGMEKVHESLRKQYADDASAEDKFKFIKNNAANPASPSHTHTTEGI